MSFKIITGSLGCSVKSESRASEIKLICKAKKTVGRFSRVGFHPGLDWSYVGSLGTSLILLTYYFFKGDYILEAKYAG